MANSAKIQSITKGQFFIKDSPGNLVELKVGDIVSLNDTIVAASSNTDASKMEIFFDTNELIILSQGEQLLDTTLIASTFENEELAFDKNGLDEALSAWKNTQNDETNMETAAGDVAEQITNAGDEQSKDGGALRSKFNSRDGDAIDIISDLRELSWTGETEEINEDTENMLLEQSSSIVYTIIDGLEVVNEGNGANYIVKLVDAEGNPVIATQDTIIYIKYTNKTTSNDDTEFDNEEIITVIIPKGSLSIEFKVKTNKDNLIEDDEVYNLEIERVDDKGQFCKVQIGDKDGERKDIDTIIRIVDKDVNIIDLSYKADAQFVNGSFILAKDMNINFDNIGKLGFENIDKIDLSANGKNELLNITLQDILDMGKNNDGNINLTILGDSQDKVSFADSSQWQKTETTIIENGKTFIEWSNTLDSTVTLKIEQQLSDGITN
ncbi:hypothetical protein CRU87_08885 [Aliarcobacter trophiarum LMG 25534]|uniref:Calx-beta domain-containing protein n=1 Tax=Aliarcobacter trophiarum LMG 25534 TaxID=1032241 RepID=A0ABY0EX09_9BACT|nr:hypothetical protein [Aliarcobacter trophiarum]RXI25768.1 hypothetical protein CRU89_07470 [Aliarcobacter trophiarum]RXJ89609.1 hypothetical protein CRU87_08885 [Aliarcobacter trophiarum LMG 25534]